tara:strand:+ start:7720 stop:9405 length:1686 start_codon:yes stop_codon:yes gene_type:complete
MTPRRKWHLLLVFASMLLLALLEVLLVFAVLPFGATISGAKIPLIGSASHTILAFINDDALIASAILLLGSVLIVMVARLMLTVMTARFLMKFGHDLSMRVYNGMLDADYHEYISSSSSDLVARMARVQDVTIGYVQPMMQALVGMILAFSIGVTMFVLDPLACLTVGAGLVLVFFMLSRLTWPRLHSNAAIIAYNMSASSKAVLEAHGGLRAIILQGSQREFSTYFRNVDRAVRNAAMSNSILSTIPRFVIEATAIVLLTLITVHLTQSEGGFVAAVPILGALAIGARRILPLLTSSWQNYSTAIGNTHTVIDVIDYLNQAPFARIPCKAALPMLDNIRFEKVFFEYDAETSTNASVIKGISFQINRGDHIGIAGETGSGKTTVLDLMLGLLRPTEGKILIDGKPLDEKNRAAWQKNIGHVPQDIFLINDTIAANIAFGCEHNKIDMARVRDAARKACLGDFINALTDGYQSLVGERGIKLSGGQQQRIGIARALYGNPTVLVLDEATSALDNVTEAQVMQSISQLSNDITIITVAHRASTLQFCDNVIFLENGRFDAGM